MRKKTEEQTTEVKKKDFSPEDAIQFAISFIQDSLVPPTDLAAISTIHEKLSDELPHNAFPPEALETMATEIYRQAQARISATALLQSNLTALSLSDFAVLDDLIQRNALALSSLLASAPLTTTSTTFSKQTYLKILASFTAHALTTYHHSGWMRYDRKEIFAIATPLSKLSATNQTKLTQDLHALFGIDMRVIGSNQPIPCYSLPWLVPPQTPQELLITKLDTARVYTSILLALTDDDDDAKNN